MSITPNPIFCALDTPDLSRAAQLTRELADHIGGVKIGMEFFYAHGASGFHTIAQTGVPIFLDLKLHDIPNTVAQAIRALAPLAPAILNVHASGGLAMMKAAREATQDIGKDAPLLVGVTVLTSLDQADLDEMGIKGSPQTHVLRLAELAQKAGLGGVVCSAHEIERLRKACGRDFKLIVPGIRPLGHATNDQKRVMTPEQAVKAGADILVIGRAITKAPMPAKAASDILHSLTK